ncbi:MAG: hypothetical protein J3Q66DRAFT_350403 [Benniella sp.]|nr:MAG: hypothetical protein J3Q66DRAFT_350403 [Benniella sp.]
MLGLPELDRMVCQELSRYDLAQCTRVNKEWHHTTFPYLWRDLSCLELCSAKVASAFRRLVIVDYFNEQRNWIQDDGRGKRQRIQTRWSRSLATQATLSKYCPWIRELPHPRHLLRLLQPSHNATHARQTPSGLGQDPPALDLLRHFYRHCSAMLMEMLHLEEEDFGIGGLLKIVAEFVIPRVRHIKLVAIFLEHPENVKYVLDHCSCKLEELSIIIDMSKADNNLDWGQEAEGYKAWGSLKRLNLWYCRDKSESKVFWPWLWKRCGQVEMLTMGMIKDTVNSLGEGMISHMPNLKQIEFGRNNIPFDATDDELAVILTGARKGWTALSLGGASNFKEASVAVFSRYLTTLELLMVGRDDDTMIQMVSRCPSLHTLIFFDEQNFWRGDCSGFKAETFIDRDPYTGALKPWLCEASLQCLTLHISGIPRPDLLGNVASHETVIEETYPGQGREIQSQVYDRITRFTNLRVLKLGNAGMTVSAGVDHRVRQNHFDCLEMSLESGLSKLAELKALMILDVSDMKTRIGVKEVKWMVEHWPNLRYVGGLQGNSMEVVYWLQKSHRLVKCVRHV